MQERQEKCLAASRKDLCTCLNAALPVNRDSCATSAVSASSELLAVTRRRSKRPALDGGIDAPS